MIADMKAGVISVLVVWQSGRIERRGAYNAFDLARRVRDAGGRIEYVDDQHLNGTNEMSDVLLALAATGDKKYSENISKNTKHGHDRSRANNASIGRAPYGYRNTGEVKYHKGLVAEASEAAVIREATRRYLAGETIDGLCDDFNARGIPSPTWKGQPGKHWHGKTLAALLRSPSIAGRRVNAGGKTEYEYAPIISWQDHLKLVARLNSRAHRKGISPGNVALLTSLLTDDAGHAMPRIKAWQGVPLYYCRKPGCHTSVNLAAMDARVNAMFLRWEWPETRNELVPGENHAEEIARLQQDRSELDDITDPAGYDQRHAELTAEIRRLAALPAEPDRMVPVETGRTMGQAWEGMTDAAKRDYVKSLGLKFIYHADGTCNAVPTPAVGWRCG